MRKFFASLITALLLTQPYLLTAQKIFIAPSLLNQAFDGSPEERYTDGTALMKTVKTVIQEGRRVSPYAEKTDPSDKYDVSWRWVPGKIYNDYRVTRHYKILDRTRYAETKANTAKVGSGVGMGFLAAGIGTVAGLALGFGAKSFFKFSAPKAAAVGLIAGLVTAVGSGIPLVKTMSRAAFDSAYQAALKDPADWTRSEDSSQLAGTFDEFPPLDSPAHPDRLTNARERKRLAEERERLERERRRLEDERRRLEDELNGQLTWYAVKYEFRTNGYSVFTEVTLNNWFFNQINRRGYVEVRLYAGDQRGQEKRLRNRSYEMTSRKNSFAFPSREVCDRDELLSYDRYLKVWVSPRNSDGSPMTQYRELRGARVKVTCKGLLWEASEILEAIAESAD